MAQFDVTQSISAYSTHFFPADAGVPIFVTVYKTGSATADDVAGYLMFTNHPLTGNYSDRLHTELQAIVKHFSLNQFGAVLSLLQHRVDHLKQGMSLHYVGDHTSGGWTTLDAGASPGLDPLLLPVVTSTPRKEESLKIAIHKKKPGRKKSAVKK